MPDKEVKSNGKTFGEGTRLTLNVKTIAWILGILVVIFTYFYVDMRKRYNTINDNVKAKVEEEMTHYKTDMSEVKIDLKDVVKSVGTIEVNVGILLDRSNGNRNSGTSTTTAEENIPTTINGIGDNQ